MAEQIKPAPTADRRTVLRASALGVAAVGIGAGAAACSSGNSMPQGSGAQSVAAATGGPVTTSEVPVGGGFIDADSEVVVTQPEAGSYKAFSAICTHQGCTVGSVIDNVIQCDCHGSQFSAKDGSVISGPALKPLAPKTVSVSGKTITVGA